MNISRDKVKIVKLYDHSNFLSKILEFATITNREQFELPQSKKILL